jgi:hypothetical protein
MRVSKRRLLQLFGHVALYVSVSTILTLAALKGPVSASAAPYWSGCQNDWQHFYAQALSGYPAVGTRLHSNAPTQWSVRYDTGVFSHSATMDEASWVTNQFDVTNSIEGGYFSGRFPYDNTWTNSLLPYITFKDGTYGGNKTYAGIPGGTSINEDVVEGSSGYVNVYTSNFPFNYSVANGTNVGQGEIYDPTGSSASWMGNGSGNSFTGYWSNNGTNWYNWGWNNDCANSPYWGNSTGASTFQNGGY